MKSKQWLMLCSIVMIAFCLNSGCISRMLAGALVPGPNPRPSKSELDFNKEVNIKVLDTLAIMVKEADGKITDNVALKKLIVKAVNKESDRAHNAGKPSTVSMLGNQIIGNTTRPMVEEGIRTGMEWGKGLIGTTAGGAGGLGLLAMRLLGKRKERKLKIESKIYKDSLDDAGMSRAMEAAKHTEVENIVA